VSIVIPACPSDSPTIQAGVGFAQHLHSRLASGVDIG
jgi:hypothetical protein